METNKIMKFMKKIGEMSNKYKPAILTGTAVVGLVATAVMVFKASPKCHDALDRHEKKMEKINKADKKAIRAERIEVTKEVAKTMAAPAIMGTVTVGCIFGSHSVSSRRIAALSAAYSISESALKDLNAKMTDTLGESKTRSIKDAIIKDKMKGEKIKEDDPVLIFGDGDCLCKDGYSGRMFRSNAQKIGLAINNLSAECMSSMYVSLNDFYDELDTKDLPRIPLGDDLGWNIDDCINGTLPITYTAILTDDGRPCLYVDYNASVRSDYRNLR